MYTSKKLYILPFDHRGSFIKMFGFIEKDLTLDQLATLCDYKHIVYEGFLMALEMGVSKEYAAILVDEQFGLKIHQEAKDAGIARILTTEKSGQDEFDFEYGDKFGEHIKNIQPDYTKVLVRYNIKGDKELNKRQIERLKLMNDFCKKENYRFLFELLAVATPEQIADLGGSQEKYDTQMRGEVMVNDIKEFQDNGISPDVWKLEGLADFDQMKRVVEQARKYDNNVGVVVLGRGESEERVKEWLTVAAKIEGVIGFAVGRTVFKQALTDFKNGVIGRGQAVEKIAKNYKGFVDLFEGA